MTLLLNRSDVQSLMPFDDLLVAMDRVFAAHARGETLGTGLIHGHGVDGEFHIKAGGLKGERPYYAVKANGGFFRNRERFGLPNIQGAIILFDAVKGYPVALMDSVEITGQRTAATTALAARYLARKGVRSLTLIGTGRQGRLHLRALSRVLQPERVFVAGRDAGKLEAFARGMSAELGIPVTASDVEAAIRQSDVVVTCTPARAALFPANWVKTGAFVAAVGADSPAKQEMDPALFSVAKVVVDVLEQCADVGDLHHAIAAGVIEREDVYGSLGEVAAGLKPGRESEQEIVLFDSTGTALQDTGAAAMVYENAVAKGVGIEFDLFG
jgi:ornithine cyclodeaminase/alanine dehydrogenase-like protein (mu-crystallin family)